MAAVTDAMTAMTLTAPLPPLLSGCRNLNSSFLLKGGRNVRRIAVTAVIAPAISLHALESGERECVNEGYATAVRRGTRSLD